MSAPVNDSCAGAIVVASLPYSITVDTTEATDDAATPDSEWGSGDSRNGVWFKWTAPSNVTRLRLRLSDPDFEGVATVFSGTCGALVDTLNGGYSDYPAGHEEEFTVVPGTVYYVLLTSYDAGGMAACLFELEHPQAVGQLCAILSCTELATFPRRGAWTGGDRLLVWARFYGRHPTTGALKETIWSGHMLWDPSSYEGGIKIPKVLSFGHYERPMSGPRGDVRLTNVSLQLDDSDREFRGMLGNDYQYALNNTEVVIKAILESDWRARKRAVTIFRGLVNAYDVPEAEFLFDFKDWLGSRLDQPLPMFKLTQQTFPNLPADQRNTYAPYVYGKLSDDTSAAAPPTIVQEPAQGSWLDAGVYPWNGYGNITDCLAAPPSGVSVVIEPGGALSLTQPNPGEYGVMLASIDSNGKLSDSVPFGPDVDQGGGRGSFGPTPVPFDVATAGNQQLRVDFTPGAGAVKTRVWIGIEYFGARWTYYLDVVAPGATVTFDKHPAFRAALTAATMTTGGKPVDYTFQGSLVVAGILPDGETTPSVLINFRVMPYRRPVRIAFSHPTATAFAVYRTTAAGPSPGRHDWTMRAETDQTFFEFTADGQDFEDVDGLFAGTGRVPVKYLGPYIAPLSGATLELFLVGYGAVSEIVRAFQNELPVDPGSFNTTWAVPGLGTAWTDHFGADLFLTIGGHRFTVIGLLGPDGADAASGTRPIALDVIGYETVGDASGTALVSLYRCFLHLLKNQVIQETAHVAGGGDWLPMPLWADGTDRILEAAFLQAELEATTAIGSPNGGFLITEPRTIGEWMRRILLGLDCGFGWNREGQAIIALLPPPPSVGWVSADTVDHIRDSLKGSFHIRDDETQLFTSVPIAYDFDHVAGDYGRRRTLTNPTAAVDYRVPQTAPELELLGRLSSLTATKVGQRALQRMSKPERTIVMERGLAALDLDLGVRYKIDHPQGATATGFIQRPAQINKIQFAVDEGTVEVSSWDLDWIGLSPLVDYLVEEIMAEIDLGGSREFSPVLTNSSPQTVELFDRPARSGMVQWEILPDDAIVTCYVSGRVEASGISMRAILYNDTDAAEVEDAVIVSTVQVDTSFVVPRPLDGDNKEYRLRMEVTASGLPNPLSTYDVFLKGKLRTLFVP